MTKKFIVLSGVLLLMFSLCSCDEYISPGINDYAYNLPYNCILYHASDTTIWMEKADGSSEIIEPNVTGIAWNDNFILAEQSKDETLHYWIIDVKTDKIYGSLTENDFQIKKKELNVSDELKLENPEKYKYLEKKSVE